MRSIAFTVPYIPVKRRVRFTHAGRPYTDGKTRAEMRGVAMAFRNAGGMMHDGRVELSVTICGKLPKSTPKRVESDRFTVKPDVDNVLKAVSDALNGIAYADDAYVTRADVEKLPRIRREGECTRVEVRWLDA
jgi:Holliday junction resolvase RusA-like endonuclease